MSILVPIPRSAEFQELAKSIDLELRAKALYTMLFSSDIVIFVDDNICPEFKLISTIISIASTVHSRGVDVEYVCRSSLKTVRTVGEFVERQSDPQVNTPEFVSVIPKLKNFLEQIAPHYQLSTRSLVVVLVIQPASKVMVDELYGLLTNYSSTSDILFSIIKTDNDSYWTRDMLDWKFGRPPLSCTNSFDPPSRTEKECEHEYTMWVISVLLNPYLDVARSHLRGQIETRSQRQTASAPFNQSKRCCSCVLM
jgi:hypothetical protein